MPIISSLIITAQPQQNGTLLVHEQHTDHLGTVYDHIYNAAADAAIEWAAQLRGQNIGAELDKRTAAFAEAVNFEIPLTDIDIMQRLTPAEWDAFQTATDIDIAYFRAVFARAKIIYRTHALTLAGFSALVSAGILTQSRVDEVLA